MREEGKEKGKGEQEEERRMSDADGECYSHQPAHHVKWRAR
jgi:hypothetical protein